MKISSVTLIILTFLASTAASVLANPPVFERFPTGTFPEKSDRNLISVEGRFGYGSCYTVHSRGDTLLTGNGPVLEIFDFADPDKPVRLGSLLLSGSILSIHSEGSVAFVYSVGLGLAIIDISTLSSPQIISVIAAEERVFGQAKRGDLLYLANGYTGLRIINVADPARPVEIGSYHNPIVVFSVALDGDLAYLSCSSDGLRILDVSNPAQPQEIGQDLSLIGGYGLALRGKYLFASDRNGLRVYDVSNPTQPIQVAGLLQWVNGLNLVIRDNVVFLTCISQYIPSLIAIDITDPENPTVMGSLDGNLFYSVTSGSKWLYGSVGGYGLKVINVTNPENPVIVGSFDEHGHAVAVGIHGGHAYLAIYFDDLRILDVSNISQPLQVGTYPTPNEARNIALQGQVAYFATYGGRIQILDVSNPSSPMTIGSLPVDNSYDVAVRGDLAVGVGQYGLYMFDVSNPSSPKLLGNYSSSPHRGQIGFTGDFVFLTESGVGVHVIDVQDPTFPHLVRTIDRSENYSNVTISENQAYLSAGEDGVEVYDISDPSAPIFLGATKLEGYVYDIAVDFPNAYVAETGNGLTVLDIRDPAHILTVGSFDIPSGLNNISLADGLIWATGFETGMWILRHNTASDVPGVEGSGAATLLEAYPNPFNPQTTIGFHLSGQQTVSLDVFSVNGRRVASLVEGVLDSGPHQVVWAGRDDAGRSVASGTYFYRLDADGNVQTKSMVLIK